MTPTERLRVAVPGGMTCSAGIASWEPGDTLPILLARADAALYDSKRAGRNRTSSRSGNRAAEAMQLRQAIADDELRAFYQPVVNLSTGVVTGVEALVRWLRPGPNGPTLIAPDSFIPLAEECGAITQLGQWMLSTACRQGALWSSQGLPLTVNVNVSGRELVDAGYAESVLALLSEVGLPPRQLVLGSHRECVGRQLGAGGAGTDHLAFVRRPRCARRLRYRVLEPVAARPAARRHRQDRSLVRDDAAAGRYARAAGRRDHRDGRRHGDCRWSPKASRLGIRLGCSSRSAATRARATGSVARCRPTKSTSPRAQP